MSDYFSPQISWSIGLVGAYERWFGYLNIEECKDKPIICKKNSGKDLKNGEIYYRYRGQSKAIEFPELKSIHFEIRQRERKYWMAHIERIAKVEPQNIALVDLLEGSIDSPTLPAHYLIDEDLLEKLKETVCFIEEGKFTEKNGSPTLRLIGDLSSCDEIVIPEFCTEMAINAKSF